MAGNRILASVSHELRTPLNAITGFSDMLLCEMFGPFRDPRQKEYVDLISQSARHLLAVVNSLLDASRLGSGTFPINPEPFRFRDAVEFSRSLLASAAAERCIEIAVELGPEIDQLVADRYAVQQILINLLSNALKFTPEGGRVVIGGRRIGARLNFWVSDTGIGISAEDLSLVGRPFVQIRKESTQRFDGAGLGLSIVKGLVSLHDGTIQIASEPGIGTTVTVCLPLEGPGRPAEEGLERVIALPGVSMREARDGALRRTG
jgi:cell cycle sensor histidine kinase DivJ